MADPQSTPSDGDGDAADGDLEESPDGTTTESGTAVDPETDADSEQAAGTGDTEATDSDTATDEGDADSTEELTTAELRQQVEQKYDFDEFGPTEMADMSPEEWEAAFDPDTWITGEELLDRAEADLKYRVQIRDVFARVERLEGGRLVAYSDQGYALVHPDGGVEGFGTVLRDVKPVVALCSMESYDVPDAPEGEVLPRPAEVPEGGGELGNRVIQAVAGAQLLAGVALLLSWLGFVTGLLSAPTTRAGQDANLTLLVLSGLGFLVIGGFLLMVVANARLSDRFRAEEFRERLRAIGVGSKEYPEFLPVEDGRWVGDRDRRDGGASGQE